MNQEVKVCLDKMKGIAMIQARAKKKMEAFRLDMIDIVKMLFL